jgi:hypothetical protein
MPVLGKAGPVLASIATQLPLEELQDLASELFGRGFGKAQVLDELVAIGDALVDWSKVIRGPAGAIAEAGDGPLLRAFLRVVVGAVARRKAA